MSDFQILILLMSAAVLLVCFSQKTRIPYPITLVIGGGLLSFIPDVDFSYFDPNLLLTIVLPPILYHAAFWTSMQGFKKHYKEICSLALGLVVVTTLVIGCLFKWCFPDYSWALAFAFGAIVSPPDAAAATSVLKRFPLGQKLITILEGESLVNDASALVLYRIAVAAILSGTFSFWEATFDFFYMALGGVLFGTLLGYSFQFLSRRYLDPVVGVFSSLLIPYIIYICSTVLDISGVLAVVAAGIIASRIIFKHQTSLRRMLGHVTWDMYVILLNCFIFVLIGSQLDEQTATMSWDQIFRYTGYALLFTFVMFVIRLIWACIKGTKVYFHTQKDPELVQILKDGVIIGWVGMRGIVSLTAALALPFNLADGTPVAGRAEVIYIVFCVILLTLVIPGSTLSYLIRWLKLPTLPQNDLSEATRKNLAKVAQEEIARLKSTNSVSDEEHLLLVDYFHNRYRLWQLSGNHHQLESARKKVVQTQRRVLLEIWEQGEIDDKLLAQIEHELDSEETQTAKVEI
ncbi:MAG: Na+/H+ antiporter [Verrucomicrobia bacterium]|nr:Na+/H+ antiporter [Verrucomicrobiota bacterium]